jgi:hypothetical protein
MFHAPDGTPADMTFFLCAFVLAYAACIAYAIYIEPDYDD